jgi:hypothetical protein
MLIPDHDRYTTPTRDFCRIDARCFLRDRSYYPRIPYGSGPHCVAILKHALALCLTFETTATPALSTRRSSRRGRNVALAKPGAERRAFFAVAHRRLCRPSVNPFDGEPGAVQGSILLEPIELRGARKFGESPQ